MDATTTRTQLCSEHDFALDVPGFHEELSRLRRDHRVAYVPFHGGTAYLLTSYHDVEQAFLDETTLPAEAAYRLHSEPVLGRTLQCMTGRDRPAGSHEGRIRLSPQEALQCIPTSPD